MVLTVQGSRKFASFSERKINKALKFAKDKGIIQEIPSSYENKLELFRKIAVVANNSKGYSFLYKQPS